jgi:DNA polymerase-3 subunit epsilon
MIVKFVAIDLETANPSLASVCQIGVAIFDGGKLADKWATFVNPGDYFNERNVAIHGINEETIKGAPEFPEVFVQLRGLLGGKTVVHHTGFDRVALFRAAEKHELSIDEFQCDWLDTAKVARRAWAQFESRGYGLANVASTLGIMFKHHDALEDARAAGEILLAAARETGFGIAEWLDRVAQPISGSRPSGSWSENITRDGNPDGPLAGEILVFTGALSIPREEAANLAADAGCDVAASVTKKTTLLVVGDQDIRMLAGHEKSSKHRKAEELMSKGQCIRILCETDFARLVRGVSG